MQFHQRIPETLIRRIIQDPTSGSLVALDDPNESWTCLKDCETNRGALYAILEIWGTSPPQSLYLYAAAILKLNLFHNRKLLHTESCGSRRAREERKAAALEGAKLKHLCSKVRHLAKRFPESGAIQDLKQLCIVPGDGTQAYDWECAPALVGDEISAAMEEASFEDVHVEDSDHEGRPCCVLWPCFVCDFLFASRSAVHAFVVKSLHRRRWCLAALLQHPTGVFSPQVCPLSLSLSLSLSHSLSLSLTARLLSASVLSHGFAFSQPPSLALAPLSKVRRPSARADLAARLISSRTAPAGLQRCAYVCVYVFCVFVCLCVLLWVRPGG